MRISNIAPEENSSNIDSIMAILEQANTTITPEVMREINQLSSTKETHQDDSEITKLVHQRLSECNDDEVSKIREFLDALNKTTISTSDKISIMGELKMELADNKQKSIYDILGKCHEIIIQSIKNVQDNLADTMTSGPNTLH